MIKRLQTLALLVPVLMFGLVYNVGAEGTDTIIDELAGEITTAVGDIGDGIVAIAGPVLLVAGGVFVAFFGWRVVKKLIKGAK